MTLLIPKRTALTLIFIFALIGCSGGSDSESVQNNEKEPEAVWDQTKWDQSNWQ